MFKDTLEFFNEVANGEVAFIDIDNYLSRITDNFKINKLELLKADLESYIYVLESKYYSRIPREKVISKIYPYNDYPQDDPRVQKMNKKVFDEYIEKNIIVPIKMGSNLSEENEESRKEKCNWYLGNNMAVKLELLFPFNLEQGFFMLSCLKEDIDRWILEKTDPNPNQKHDHIFANNGFVLFKYIMENYVPFIRGWQSNLSYYYWRLFEDKFVHQRPERFKDWFVNDYQKDSAQKHFINKIKTKNQVKNPNRQTNYKLALKYYELNQIP